MKYIMLILLVSCAHTAQHSKGTCINYAPNGKIYIVDSTKTHYLIKNTKKDLILWDKISHKMFDDFIEKSKYTPKYCQISTKQKMKWILQDLKKWKQGNVNESY